MRRLIGLLFYSLAIALPIAFAVFGRWYAGVWGFAFSLDPLGLFVILLMTGPFSVLFFMIGYRLRNRRKAVLTKVS